MSGPYDDILELPHHVSKTRARMSERDRAAQFAPFAALTGFETVVEETGQQAARRVEAENTGEAFEEAP